MKLEAGKFVVMPSEKFEELIQKITDLEKEVSNLKHAQAYSDWRDIYERTKIYEIYKETYHVD